MKILLAADGSAHTRYAAFHLVDHLAWYAGKPEIHLLNVQPPLPYPAARAFLGRNVVDEYHRSEAANALAVAEKELARARIPCHSSWRVGDVAAEIAVYTRDHGIDMVVMGSHGHGVLANVALGSVATKCIATLDVPVLIIRAPRIGADRAPEGAGLAESRP